MQDTAFGFYEIAKELLDKRFTYFETDQSYISGFAPTGGGKYRRFYLAQGNFPSCAEYYKEIASYPSQKLPFLRSLGLPVDMCIAAENTDELKSPYQKRITRSRSSHTFGGYEWSARLSILGRQTGKLIAEVSTNGYDPGGSGHGFTCPNKDQIELFDKALEPIPDPRLPPRNLLSTLDDPPPFQESIDLRARLLAEKLTDRLLSEAALGSALNPIGLDGSVSFAPRYKDEGGGSFGLSGYYLVVIQASTIKRVLVRAFESLYWNFQKVIVHDDGDIVFFARPMGAAFKDKNIAVFRYSRTGEPIAAYRIRLPDVPFGGDITFLVDHISLERGALEITLLDMYRDRRGAKAVKEYRFGAEITLK